ncbi:MAG: M14 family metallocarboxypeptidase [Verrucomicrobiota bacterium]
MQRLGKNQGAYHGEAIDIQAVLRDILHAAQRDGWRLEALAASPALTLHTLHRPSATPRKKIYISTGIHGDEPAGPLAVKQLMQGDEWPDGLDLWLCPCLNPTGFPLNRRENANGVDLNRDYRHLESDEIRAHVAWLERLPQFDLTLCLHEDWESHGFYLYELNPHHRPSLAERIIDAVAKVCPIDPSTEIEGRAARGGIIRPDLDPTSRPQWPEAFYLIQNKTPLSYTLEAPSDWPLPVRVAALVAAVRAAVTEI